MTVKLLGAALFVLCGGIIGYHPVRTLKQQLRLLECIDSALGIMEGEISLCARPLPDIFDSLSRTAEKKQRDIFSEIKNNCLRLSGGEAWCLVMGELELPEEARRALCALGTVLGNCDGKRQSAEISNVRAKLAFIGQQLRAQLESKAKSYPGIGAGIAGIAAMLIV